MASDYDMAILAVTKIIVANNAGCIAKKIKEAGYETKDRIPASELESALLQLHIANKGLYFDVMKNCTWNNGNSNWTNDEQVKEKLISAVETHTGKKVDKANWWITTVEYLEKQQ